MNPDSNREERLSLGKQPSVLQQMKKYGMRNQLFGPNKQWTVDAVDKAILNLLQEASQSITSVPELVIAPEVHRIPEQLFFDNSNVVKGSFESIDWFSVGENSIIMSSPNQKTERKSLHSLLGNLDIGCTAHSNGNVALAGLHWRKAFREINTLVTGVYHDNIPNLIQKINDLNSSGHPKVAAMLKDQISQTCDVIPNAVLPLTSIYRSLQHLELSQLPEVEDRIMAEFAVYFSHYLGDMHYNAFVMRMNAARRRLVRDRWARIEEHVPSLFVLELTFDPWDKRCLDVLLLRWRFSAQEKNTRA
jgi:hypothetical protein